MNFQSNIKLAKKSHKLFANTYIKMTIDNKKEYKLYFDVS